MPAVVYELKKLQRILNFSLLVALFLENLRFFIFEEREEIVSIGGLSSSCGISRIVRLEESLFYQGNSILYLWRICVGIDRLGSDPYHIFYISHNKILIYYRIFLRNSYRSSKALKSSLKIAWPICIKEYYRQNFMFYKENSFLINFCVSIQRMEIIFFILVSFVSFSELPWIRYLF